jgi:hypothetical protein
VSKSIGEIVVGAWEHTMRTTEDPLRKPYYLFSRDPRSYREQLHASKLNYYGEVIPQIEIVRQNLQRLKQGNTRMWRGLNVLDRRQRGDRRRGKPRR